MYKIRPKEFVNSSFVFGTMSSRCLIALCLLVAAHSASIKKRNIPVEVLYEKSNLGNRNLEERVQISHNDLLRLKLSDDIINEGREEEAPEAYVSKIQSYGVRNLDAKVQLSPEELQQAVKHLPNVDDEDLVKAELQNSQTPENATHTLDMLKKVEEIVFAGICTIKENVDRLIENNSKPSDKEWEKLNQTLQNFFAEQHRKISLKQDQPTDNQNNQNQNNQNNQFFENLMNGFQSITNNFIQTYFPQNQQNNGTEDEQSGQGQQGGNPFQNFINMFQGGINNIVNNFQNNNNGTGQEDTGNEQNNNFFGNVVNSIQQFFSNQNPSQSSNNQSDTGTPSNNQGPTQIFQSIGNQIGNFFNPTTKPPNSPEDEGTGSTTQSNFINNIGQAFQNFNFFGQSTTPASQGGGGNPISQVSNQFQQLVGGQGGNPIEGIQNAIGGGGSTTEKNKGDGEKSQEDAGTPANEKMPQEEGGSATPANEKMVEKNEGSSTVTSVNEEEPQKEGSTENKAQKNEEISTPQKKGSTENEMLAQKNEEISTSAAPEVKKNTEEMVEVAQKVE